MTSWKLIVAKVPPPKGDPDGPLRAMIIDSWFDTYVGVVMLVRVVDGELRQGRALQDDGHQRRLPDADNLGVLRLPTCRASRWRRAKWVTSSRASRSCRRPRWATPSPWKRSCPTISALPASRCLVSRKYNPRCLQACTPPRPISTTQLRDALEKLKLNDAALRYEPEVSQALGFGFRCGFLGLLHMEIVQERLEREFDQDLITTAPSVVYEVRQGRRRSRSMVENPSKMPDQGKHRRRFASPSSPCTCTCPRTMSAR